ncbi:Kelch-Like Protein 4 [Manis pentadactyla]|nr:Kelch-Like Protein 4 [Manis pentadactyla]
MLSYSEQKRIAIQGIITVIKMPASPQHPKQLEKKVRLGKDVINGIKMMILMSNCIEARALQNWHPQNLMEHLRVNEDIPKAIPEENLFKEACEKHSQDLEMMADGNTEDSTAS